MPLYFVTSLTNPAAVLAAAEKAVPEGDVHAASQDKFFIRFEGTSNELSEKLGVADGSTGTAIILLVTAYHGRAPKSIWEWVAQKQGAK